MSVGFWLANSAKLSCYFLRKNAPRILTITSAVTAVGACIGTGVATWNSKEAIEVHNSDIHDLHEKLKKAEEKDKPAVKNEIIKEYKSTAGVVARNYSIPAIFLVASVASGIASNSISQARIAALGASYAVLRELYSKYRANVVDKYGKEADADLAYEYSEEVIEQKDAKGKIKQIKKKTYDPYAVLHNNECAILVGDGIECNFTGDWWGDIALLNSAISYCTYDVIAGQLVTVYDFYKRLGVRASKDQVKKWSSYRFSRDLIQLRLDNLEKSLSVRTDLTELQKKELRDKATMIDVGFDSEINVHYKERTEPTLWIIPECVPIDYEDTYIYEKQAEEHNKFMEF